MIDESVYQMAKEPETEELLCQFWIAKDEDRPALAQRVMVVQPGLVVALLSAAIPHLVERCAGPCNLLPS